MYSMIYVRPPSLDVAVALLHEHPEARPLSGGMTLIPTLKQRLAAPSHLVDLSHLQELRGITAASGVLRIGAATTHADVACSPVVAGTIPALSQLASMIADPQVRNRGTMGGSVANNDPAADYPAAMLALDATIVTNDRRIAADDFFVGMFETALAPGEVIVALECPRPDAASYIKYRHPASGYALVGVFIACRGTSVRVAVTGAASSVFRWRDAEERLSVDRSAKSLQDLRIDPSQLLDDAHIPQRYRASLVETCTRRSAALLAA